MNKLAAKFTFKRFVFTRSSYQLIAAIYLEFVYFFSKIFNLENMKLILRINMLLYYPFRLQGKILT